MLSQASINGLRYGPTIRSNKEEKEEHLHHFLRLCAHQTTFTTKHPLATNLSQTYLLTIHHLIAILTHLLHSGAVHVLSKRD